MFKRGFLRTFELLLALSILAFFLYSLNNISYEYIDYKDFILNEYANDIYKIQQSCILLNKNCSSFDYSNYNLDENGTYCVFKTIVLINKTKTVKVCFKK